MSEPKKEYLTPKFRASYPALFKPTKMPGAGDEQLKYSIEMLIPKDQSSSTEFKALQKGCMIIAKEKFGEQTNWKGKKGQKGKFWPIQDGDKLTNADDEPREETKGCWVIKANRKAEFGPPPVVAPNPKIKLAGEDFYAGCWARANVSIGIYDNSFGRGVSVYLLGVQKLANGKPLGGGKTAEQMFGAEVSSDEFDLADEDQNFGSDDSDSDEETEFEGEF